MKLLVTNQVSSQRIDEVPMVLLCYRCISCITSACIKHCVFLLVFPSLNYCPKLKSRMCIKIITFAFLFSFFVGSLTLLFTEPDFAGQLPNYKLQASFGCPAKNVVTLCREWPLACDKLNTFGWLIIFPLINTFGY